MSLIAVNPGFKIVFFDRKVIRSNWKRMNANPIHKAGMLVRRIARGSIRRRSSAKAKWKRKPSPKGQPPRSWRAGKTPPFKMIFAVPDRVARTVVGMVGFGGSQSPVPGLHEHGGSVTRTVFVKAGQRRTKRGRFGKTMYRTTRKVVRYPQRPFMNPALMEAKSRLPQLWAGSLSGQRLAA